MAPTVTEELRLLEAGCGLIAGVDEAGRGCWAGPVVAAAVVLDAATIRDPGRLAGVDDSKALSARMRESLYEQIVARAVGWGVGVVPAAIVDTHGIMAATRIAMEVALLRLPCMPDALLIDAVRLPGWPCRQESLIKGDARCLSIAAASVVAKVTRDRLMAALDRQHPEYGFAAHKGYGTAAHQEALRYHGPLPQHRHSFQPLVDLMYGGPSPGPWRLPAHEE